VKELAREFWPRSADHHTGQRLLISPQTIGLTEDRTRPFASSGQKLHAQRAATTEVQRLNAIVSAPAQARLAKRAIKRLFKWEMSNLTQRSDTKSEQRIENAQNSEKDGGPSRNRTGVHGFAVRYVTTPPSGHPIAVSGSP
jgi:hypothetical protein